MTSKQTRRTFSREYKLDVIQQSYRCGKIVELARELDMRPELIYRWRAEYKDRPDISFPGKGIAKQTPEEKQNAKLRRELNDVRIERDILKKALGIFTNHPK